MITLTAGGGHIHASKAIYKQIKEKAPHTRFVFFDVHVDTFGKKLGKSFNWIWNTAQEKGDVKFQEVLRVVCHPISEKLFWLPIFFKTLYILTRHKFDRIIDTQVMGTQAIIKAMQVVEFFSGKKLILERIITELPSDQITHFAKPIKQLSKKEKKLIRVSCSFSELIAKDEREEFWQNLCGISADEVIVDTLPLRLEFLKLIGKKKQQEPLSIPIFTHGEKELELIKSVVNKGFMNVEEKAPYLNMTISPTDRVSIIMLGSRPHEKATLKYVSNFIEMARENSSSNQRDLVFVFCRNYDEKPHSLLKQVEEIVTFDHDFPSNITIVPMPFQDDEVIAPLFFRSDMTITRSGGITAMELLSVCHGQIYLHQEKNTWFEARGRIGMPSWEEGNAMFLIEKKNAQFITPDTFQSLLSEQASEECTTTPLINNEREDLLST